jgi:hypothetical protein
MDRNIYLHIEVAKYLASKTKIDGKTIEFPHWFSNEEKYHVIHYLQTTCPSVFNPIKTAKQKDGVYTIKNLNITTNREPK